MVALNPVFLSRCLYTTGTFLVAFSSPGNSTQPHTSNYNIMEPFQPLSLSFLTKYIINTHIHHLHWRVVNQFSSSSVVSHLFPFSLPHHHFTVGTPSPLSVTATFRGARPHLTLTTQTHAHKPLQTDFKIDSSASLYFWLTSDWN